MEEKFYDKQEMEEEESGFDLMEWVSYFLHHWYLFVIGIIVSLGLAYLENRSWLPIYQTAGTVMIEENRGGTNSSQSMMQGFGVQSGYKNVKNQIIMLGSYDLIARVVDSIPFLNIDYISKGSFKTRNLYKTSPIIIDSKYVSQEAYNLTFKIELLTNGTFSITVDDNKLFSNFKIKGKYGQPIQHNLFFITINNVNNYLGNTELYFKFRTRESLVGDFSSRLGFGFVDEGSSVLQVTLASETAERDIDFTNKLCEIFLADNLEKKNDAANKTIKFINEQLGVVTKSLNVSQGEMTNYRRANKFIDIQSHTNDVMGKITKFETQKSELALREIYFNYLVKYLKTNMEDGEIIAPSSLGLVDPMLMASIQRINELCFQRADISPESLTYPKLTRQINNMKATALEIVKNMRVSLEIEKNDLLKNQNLANKQVDELPKKEIEMGSIDRKYKMDDNYYTYFLQKRAESEILKASNTPDNTILDKARITGVTNSDKKQKTTMMFLMFGLLIPSVLVVIFELMNATVRSSRDVEKNSSFPLIGGVRHTKSTDPLIVSKNPRSAFTEMFRVIRTRIEFIAKRKKNIMTMVTSTESGDGKTYFSINLASVYSMASKKTILVDMDIRKPSVNQRFNIIQPNGITNYLIGQCSLDEIILHLPKVDFDILPAGSIPPNPGELIRSEKLTEMFEELRRRYDFIVIDTSPIGMVTDAYSLALISDVNLFVVRNNKTNKAFYKKLSLQLKLDNIPNMFTVLNDVEDDGSRYSKYKLYKYAYLFGYSYGYTTKRKKGDAEKYFHYYEDDTEI